MAKRRSSRPKRPTVVRSPSAGISAPETLPSQTAATARVTAEEIRAEYRYVLTDLKRIGLTAAAMFALLVVLALAIT